MTTLKFGMKIPLMMLFAVFALSACTSTGFQRQNDYPSSECKRLHARGLISLEEQRKCQFGQAFEFKEDQAQTETKAAMPCCAKMKAAEDKKGGCCDSDMKDGCPCCSSMTNGKGMMCAKKDKSGVSGMDHSKMNHSGQDVYAQAMKTMHENMSFVPTGNADVDFIRGMIPHHQGAIDMAKIALIQGKDPQVKKLAQEVIRAQESEIAFMHDWLAKQGQR